MLTELQNALKSEKHNGVERGEWLWNLRELRNRITHRQLINIAVTPDEKRIIQLKTSPQTGLEVLPYLESSINKTRNLIENIIKKEPSLRISPTASKP